MMRDEKYQDGTRAQTEEWLTTYAEANPKRSTYAFCIDPKFPGYFQLCFKPGRQAPISSWPVKVTPVAYELLHVPYPEMNSLKTGFKLQHATKLREMTGMIVPPPIGAPVQLPYTQTPHHQQVPASSAVAVAAAAAAANANAASQHQNLLAAAAAAAAAANAGGGANVAGMTAMHPGVAAAQQQQQQQHHHPYSQTPNPYAQTPNLYTQTPNPYAPTPNPYAPAAGARNAMPPPPPPPPPHPQAPPSGPGAAGPSQPTPGYATSYLGGAQTPAQTRR
jgi:hypothetical protein